MKYEQSGSQSWMQLVSAFAPSALDALFVFVYVAIADTVLLEFGFGLPVRAVVGLPVVVFLPGYALVAALFPRSTAADDQTIEMPFGRAAEGALTMSERGVLSFGASVALLPILGVGHSFAGVGFGPSTLLGVLNSIILGGLAIGLVRRFQAPISERVQFTPSEWPTRAGNLFKRPSRLETVLTVALVVVALVATSSLGLALVAPNDGEQYTTMGLFTENETGALVTDDYPRNVTVGEPEELVLAVENHEQQRTTYTLVVELQRIQRTDDAVSITQERELAREEHTLGAGESLTSTRSVVSPIAGENLRLVYLLYRGAPADDPSVETAYRYVHIWLNATER